MNEKKKTAVSFIIPIFNMESKLEQCLNSILAQKGANFEIILINDGSTDQSGEICKKFQHSNQNVIYYAQENGGVSTARNRGLELAGGDWICFVDPDDYLSGSFLSILYPYTRMNADIISCCCIGESKTDRFDVHFYNENTIFSDDRTWELPGFAFSNKRPLFCQLLDDQFGTDVWRATAIGVPWGKLYRHSFLTEHKLFFDPALLRMQDNIFNMDAFYQANCLLYVDQALYIYNLEHVSGFFTGFSRKLGCAFPVIVERRYEFLKKHNMLSDGELKFLYCKEAQNITEWILARYILHPNNQESVGERVQWLRRVFSTEAFHYAFHSGNLLKKGKKQRIKLWLIAHRQYFMLVMLHDGLRKF